MDLGTNSPFWAVFFWINVVICSILAIVVVRIVRKYEAKQKQLGKDIKTPGLENIKWFFRRKLKDHDIDTGEVTHSDPKNEILN
jgi:Ni/Fe-hydrogenase subunit HybB-like protein